MKPNAYLLIISFFALFLLIAFNIYASQALSPLFLSMTVSPTKESAQELLSKLDHTQFFTSQLTYFSELFGSSIQDTLVTGELNKKQQYDRLNKILLENENNPQILLKLAILNYQDGNNDEAVAFYKRAQAIDPWLKINQMEAISQNH